MRDVEAWFGIVGLVIALAASLGAAVGIFRANIAKATIQGQKERIDTLVGQLDDRTTRLSEAEAKIAHQAAEIATLSRLKTGEAALLKIAKQIDDHHTKAMAGVTQILEKLADR